jgi:hypothetical protein
MLLLQGVFAGGKYIKEKDEIMGGSIPRISYGFISAKRSRYY